MPARVCATTARPTRRRWRPPARRPRRQRRRRRAPPRRRATRRPRRRALADRTPSDSPTRRHPRHPRPPWRNCGTPWPRQASRARLAHTGRATAHELALRRAAAHGDWMPIVRDAAQHNHISAIGLRRLMSLESGGRVHAENGSFHGLYQYCWSTWRAAWNPWRALVAVRRRSADPRHRRRHPARLGSRRCGPTPIRGRSEERSERRRRGARREHPAPHDGGQCARTPRSRRAAPPPIAQLMLIR